MNKNYINFTENFFVGFLKVLSFVLLLIILFIVFFTNPIDYFIIFIITFVLIGWIFIGKIFQLKEISFNEKYININRKEYKLDRIQKLKTGFFGKEYILIDNEKYYFLRELNELFSDKKTKLLKEYLKNLN